MTWFQNWDAKRRKVLQKYVEVQGWLENVGGECALKQSNTLPSPVFNNKVCECLKQGDTGVWNNKNKTVAEESIKKEHPAASEHQNILTLTSTHAVRLCWNLWLWPSLLTNNRDHLSWQSSLGILAVKRGRDTCLISLNTNGFWPMPWVWSLITYVICSKWNMNNGWVCVCDRWNYQPISRETTDKIAISYSKGSVEHFQVLKHTHAGLIGVYKDSACDLLVIYDMLVKGTFTRPLSKSSQAA